MIKRAFDLVVAVPLLFLASPVMMCVALAVRVTMGKPVLFRQVRTGRDGALFQILKFRTMRLSEDGHDGGRSDAARLTRLGRFLRSSSLDELPSLWNVVRGDMSLVGPRPLLPEYLPLYSPEQARRHEITPGLTGWAQVNGRNALQWDEKFALDVWYVDHRSFWLDLRILVLTAIKVFAREGIQQEGRATVEFFQGNPPGEGTGRS